MATQSTSLVLKGAELVDQSGRRRADLLIAGGMIVREAAEAVGYRSTACLDRVFRRLAGAPPGRWRAGMAAELATPARR